MRKLLEKTNRFFITADYRLYTNDYILAQFSPLLILYIVISLTP